MLFEMMLADLALEGVAQLALAENHEPRVGNFADDQMRGVDEMALALVRHERRDIADDRRADAAARRLRGR